MSIRTQRGSTRFGVAAIAAALIASLFAFASPAGAETIALREAVRFAGADRYDTAAKAALATSPSSSADIVLASGENFPDGLAAAYLAGAYGGPMLLTAKASLPTSTANALGVLANSNARVHIVGGADAVSEAVAGQVAALGYTVNRISGDDRYATAAAIAAAANNVAGVGSFQGARTAIIATGANFPDALAAGPMAYADKHPILLTASDSLSPAAKSALTSLNIKRVVVMGGESAISPAVATEIAGMNIAVQRVAGADRNETAAMLAELLLASALDGGAAWNFGGAITLALGTNFPDALAAAQVAGKGHAPIILTGSLPTASGAFLSKYAPAISEFIIMGGLDAIPQATIDAVAEALVAGVVGVTITAEEGRNTFTVSFSEKVAAAPLQGDYQVTRRATNGPAVTVTGAGTLNSSGTEVTVALSDELMVGDTITLPAGKVLTVSTPQRTNAVVRVEVGNDTTKPVATIRAFVGAGGGQPNVWVFFNEPIDEANFNININGSPQFMTVTGGVVASAAASVPTNAKITLPANTVTDLAGNKNAKTEVNANTDTNAPSIVSATYTTAPKTGASAQLIIVDQWDYTGDAAVNPAGPGDGGKVTLTAKSANADVAGYKGNGWKLVKGNSNAGSSVTITVNKNLREIGVNTPTANHTAIGAQALYDALRANTDVAAMFNIAIDKTGSINMDMLDASATTGGQTTVTVTATFNEAVAAASPAPTYTFGTAAGNKTTSTVNGALALTTGKVLVSYDIGSAAELPVSLSVGANAAYDLAANGSLAASLFPVTAG